jgi:hypothetical protein
MTRLIINKQNVNGDINDNMVVDNHIINGKINGNTNGTVRKSLIKNVLNANVNGNVNGTIDVDVNSNVNGHGNVNSNVAINGQNGNQRKSLIKSINIDNAKRDNVMPDEALYAIGAYFLNINDIKPMLNNQSKKKTLSTIFSLYIVNEYLNNMMYNEKTTNECLKKSIEQMENMKENLFCGTMHDLKLWTDDIPIDQIFEIHHSKVTDDGFNNIMPSDSYDYCMIISYIDEMFVVICENKKYNIINCCRESQYTFSSRNDIVKHLTNAYKYIEGMNASPKISCVTLNLATYAGKFTVKKNNNNYNYNDYDGYDGYVMNPNEKHGIYFSDHDDSDNSDDGDDSDDSDDSDDDIEGNRNKRNRCERFSNYDKYDSD